MSRKAQTNGAPVSRRQEDQDDMCRVCKTTRYLNPNIRFLVNPVCYHRMCENCVEQIFSHGPAPCPIAGCGKTLRRGKFRTQTFDDMKVEREVDIRRYVSSIFNRQEEEFETLRDYNNYLEETETLTFNLINKIDVEVTKAKIAQYQEQNHAVIKRNAELESAKAESSKAYQAAQSEQARQRRDAARKEFEDERRELEEGRRRIIDNLAVADGDAEKIAREGERVILKKSSARRSEQDRIQKRQAALRGAELPATIPESSTFVIHGLKAPPRPASPEKPYSPFGGMNNLPGYYVMQESYPAPFLEHAKKDVSTLAGGYNFEEYFRRSLAEAFMGLAVFVEDEVTERETRSDPASTAAKQAATSSDDVFG